MPKRILLSILFIASLVNIAPFFLFAIGGDIDFHFTLIDCFARQFWQGDLYPRWCIDANAGLGAPLFLFYFPLPYYIAALLMPLMHLGLPLYGLYALSMGLATFVTGLTCWYWLRDITSPGRALLASLIFLFIPYRMEAMLFRASYAEIWAIALLPLLMKYTRGLALGRSTAILAVAAIFALLCLTHLPAAAAGAIAGGGYLLIVAWKNWQSLWRYAVGLLWGTAMAAFYLVPAAWYRRFMADKPLVEGAHGWPNTYLSWRNISELGQGRIVLTIALTALALTLLAAWMLWRRRRIDSVFVRREIVAWTAVSAVALFLLLPASAPLYALIGPLSMVVFPWRMQVIWALALVFFITAWMQHLAGDKRRKTWKGDAGMLLALLVLLSYLVVGVRSESTPGLGQKLLSAHYAGQAEYRTRWTDAAHFGEAYVFTRFDHPGHARAVEVLSGAGKATVTGWSWRGITLTTAAPRPITLRLFQTYFPNWSARMDDGAPLPLRPETGSGLMLLDAPSGDRRIVLTHAAWRGNPRLIGGAEIISTLASLLWLWRLRRARHSFDNHRNAC